MEPVLHISLPVAIHMLHEKHYTNPMIAKIIGVTSLQVHYYHKGETKQPKVQICMAFYKGFIIDGNRILLNLYKTVEDLHQHYDLYKEVNNVN